MVRSSSAQEHPSKASDTAWKRTRLEGGGSYHQVTQLLLFGVGPAAGTQLVVRERVQVPASQGVKGGR